MKVRFWSLVLLVFCAISFADARFGTASASAQEESLWTEIADVWTEGCSLVYVEVCVREGDGYVHGLSLEDFAFVENGVPVEPPSLEMINNCPQDSVDIVLLLDFSLSMDDEVEAFFGAIPSFVAALGELDYRISCIVFNGCPAEPGGAWIPVRTDFDGPCVFIPGGPDRWATNPEEFDCLFSAVVGDLYTWPATMRGSGYEDQFGAIARARALGGFRPGAVKVFVLFTDERPIVNDVFCWPVWGETPSVTMAYPPDSVIRFCRDSGIVVLPVTPEDGSFAYSSFESPERAFYTGYYELAESTGGKWFNLYSGDYDSLAYQIGRIIASLPCCYLFRYREEQFCLESSLLEVSVSAGGVDYGSDDTTYVPPCTGWGEFTLPQPCGGITTCSLQVVELLIHLDEGVVLDATTIALQISGVGTFTLEDDELSLSDSILTFRPSTPFRNGDTVRAVFLEASDTLGCPIVGDTCLFVVDLQPPVFYDIFPPPETVLSDPEVAVSVSIYDSIAGVRWSWIDETNFSVTVNGFPVAFSVDMDSLPAVVIEAEFHNLDTVVVCVDSIPDDPTYDYCPPNFADTCWRFHIVSLHGPVAEPVLPGEGIVSACEDQGIWIAISDTEGVDSTTIEVLIGSDTFDCSSQFLSFRNGTLYFEPPYGYWGDGGSVYVELLRADDVLGAPLQNEASWSFFLDFNPPLAWLDFPDSGSFVLDHTSQIRVGFGDDFAGVDVGSSRLYVNGREYPFPEVLGLLSPDSLSGELVFDPQRFGEYWFSGETVSVGVYVCDSPDTCDPNCAEYLWEFYLPPPYGCERIPNPFTPNGDGENDVVWFRYPGLIYEAGVIYIYDLHGALVRRINVPSGFGAKEFAFWDGSDDSGSPVPEGLYIYLIEVSGEIVCEGTVTVAR